MRFDLSSSAKGYAVDRIADLLDHYGVENYLVEIGGELTMRGHNAHRQSYAIGIESPLAAGAAPTAVVRLSNASVATSGNYRNYFEFNGQRYSHTLDPRTGYPTTHDTLSVTVIASAAEVADGMATALLVMGHETGLAFAEQNELAALFQVAGENGVIQQTTSGFDRITQLSADH